MGKPGVVVIDADQQQCHRVVALLRQFSYRAAALYSLSEMEKHLQKNPCRVVVLDLDTVPATNNFFRAFKRKNPGIYILGLSQMPYHPGLEEAMGSHIYACLGKPLDPEELLYWLKSIPENAGSSGEAKEG